MENPNFKNATIQYAKFVQTSSHTEMKAIFDTFIPFILFKECLDKKEKNDQMKLLDEKKKKDTTSKILLKDLQKELIKSNTHTKKKMYNKFSKNEDIESQEDESVKSDEDPFDLTKDYEKVFNFNLITDEEKDEFRKGKQFPYLNSRLLNIINKKLLAMNILPSSMPRTDEVHFQLLAFRFRDPSLMRCPKVSFQQNVPLFGSNPSPQQIKSFFDKNNSENNLGLDNASNSMAKSSILKQSSNIHGSNGKIMKIKTMGGKSTNNFRKNFSKFKSLKVGNNNMNINNSFHSSDGDEDEKDNNIIKDKATEKGGEDDSSNNFDKSSLAKESDAGNFRRDKQKTAEIKYRQFKRKSGSRSKIYQIEAVLKPKFFFKTAEGNENKFLQCDFDLIKDQAVKTTLNLYSSDENIVERGNKIAIPSDDLRKEIFIFDPIDIDLIKGNLNSLIQEGELKKRAKLLYPYRQNFVKIIIIKLLQFLFIIKSKIANKKSLKISNLQSSNGKMKLKEIRGSNIITFSEVKPFMKSQFGHFNMDVFREAYEKKIQKNEEIKRAKKLEELQKKFLDILQKDEVDRPDYEEDDTRNERRRNDANPMDIEKDAKILLGAVYKPRKKMNYLNGLKMLIKEEAKKNKGSSYK